MLKRYELDIWDAIMDEDSNGEYVRYEDIKELISTVEEFIGYLDYTEESDSGTEFRPIQISCCRALLLNDVSDCIIKMRSLVESN